MVEGKTRFLLRNSAAIAGAVTMIVAVGLSRLGFSEPESLLSFLLLGLAFITGDLLINNYLRAGQRESVSAIKEASRRIEQSVSAIRETLERIEQNHTPKIRVIKAPSSIDDYVALWGGLKERK